jgi:hypothetical protein
MNKHVFVNQSRSKEERRARYYFLTNGCGLNRNLARSIVGRTDSHIDISLKYLDRNLAHTV